jgi:hypothetical protein
MSTLTPPFAALLGLPHRWLLLAALTAVAAIVMLGRLGPLDALLKVREPAGILALEFAWSGERAAQILTAWEGLEAVVRLQTRWDFLFLLCYPLALSLGCAMLAVAPSNPVPMIGVFVAWVVLAAIPLDAIENLSMLRMLDHGASDALARLATWCAGLKFTVLLAVVGYLLTAGGATLVQRVVND